MINIIERELCTNLKNIKNYKQVCKLESLYYQHGKTTVYKHSRNVAYYSLLWAKKLEKRFNIKFNYKNLIVGAFLHDLFLYDWHEKDKLHRWHGYRHPLTESKNAREMCDANEETTKIIETHMWPLTITKVPRSKEAFLVCFVDKIMALAETLKIIK